MGGLPAWSPSSPVSSCSRTVNGTNFGRLAGLAQARDGSLLLSDDENGIIYRIAWSGGDAPAAGVSPAPPAELPGARVALTGAAPPVPPSDTPNQLALEILPAASGALRVSSPAFQNGARIPEAYAAEGQNISPSLTWPSGPEGTRSYVVIMEDPDAAEDPPFVHWLLYNVPAAMTTLPEALPAMPALPGPERMLQGANERGSTGYYGPRPPVGDAPHHYHFQVFALDRMLDLPHGASRAELLEAMRGSVLAQGEVVGTFQR